jgi:hypothetical protein
VKLTRSILLLGLLLINSGCFNKNPATNQDLDTRIAEGTPPQTIAVLPFDDKTSTPGLARLVRESFASRLSLEAYDDIELYAIDRALDQANRQTAEYLAQASATDLGRILGADAVVFGEIFQFQRLFAGVYSQFNIGAEIRIVDTRDQQVIWRDRYIVRFHDGGVPHDIIEIPLISIRSGFSLRDTIKYRVVDELARRLIDRLPPLSPDVYQKEPGRLVYVLQAGAFLDRHRAESLRSRLQAKAFEAEIQPYETDRHQWHRVLVGPYVEWEEANSALARLRREMGIDGYIATRWQTAPESALPVVDSAIIPEPSE